MNLPEMLLKCKKDGADGVQALTLSSDWTLGISTNSNNVVLHVLSFA